MKKYLRKALVACLLAGVLFLTGGCDFIPNAIAVANLEKLGSTAAVPVPETPQRDIDQNYYPSVKHTSVPLDERSRNNFDQESFDAHCSEFEKLLKTDGNDKKVLSCYRELLSELDSLTTDYVLNDYDYMKDVTDKSASEVISELEKVYMDDADRLLILLRDALTGRYGKLLKKEMGEEIAEDLSMYEDLTREEKDLQEKVTRLQQQYYEYSINTGMDAKTRETKIKELYLELVKAENEVARLCGYDNYAEFAYENSYNRDYSPEDIADLKDAILAEYLPLYRGYVDAIVEDGAIFGISRANRLDSDEVWQKIRQIVVKVFPELLDSLDHLTGCSLYNMNYGKNKMNVGYTQDMPLYRDALIFYQPRGTCEDLRTYVHEFGHYNYFYHNDESALLSTTTLDVMEIHSQGLEVLFYNYYPVLDKTSGAGLQQNCIYTLLSNVISGMAVNEAECRIYAEKDLTTEKVDAIWDEVAAQYYLDGFCDADTWFEIPHVFQSPLYYISYAASALASLEFFTLSREDWTQSVDAYLKLSALPSAVTYREALAEIGLPDPFDQKALSALTDRLCETLKLDKYVSYYRSMMKNTQPNKDRSNGTGHFV